MEEVILRFPHLAEQISDNLDNKSLVNCKKVSREFKDFMNSEKFYYYRIIQEYTNCSDELMKNLVKNVESAIEVTFDLQEIFKKLPRGTRQNMRFLKSFWTTPLHEAAEMGNLTIFRLLLENSIDKNPSCRWNMSKYHHLGTNKTTPLHIAALKGHFSICKIIIENVENKNPAVDMSKLTPLHLAALNGHIDVCKLIIGFIREKNPKTIHGDTPLTYAITMQLLSQNRWKLKTYLEEVNRESTRFSEYESESENSY